MTASLDQELGFIAYGRIGGGDFAKDRKEFSEEDQAALSWVYSNERTAFDWIAGKARELVQENFGYPPAAPIPRKAQKAVLATMILSCHALISVKQQLQELTKQADTRLQLWSDQWRIDDNYYQPLSSSGATQLADALCIAAANAGNPQLYADVAVRNKFFLEQIGQLALDHQLKRQQSMQDYRARLQAAEQAVMACSQQALALSRHTEPVEFSVGASTTGGNLSVTLPQHTSVEDTAETIGREVLQRQQLRLEEISDAKPSQQRRLEHILSADMLNMDPSLFLAYNHTNEVMEVYEIRTTPDSAAGVMLQAGHAHIREHDIPHYINCRVQKYRSVDATLEYQQDEPEAGWTNIRLRRHKYGPVKLLNDTMQQELSKVLKDKLDIKGGCCGLCCMESCQIPAFPSRAFRQPTSPLPLLACAAGLAHTLARLLAGRCSRALNWPTTST